MDTDQLIRYILTAAKADGCVIIEPRKEPFRPRLRSFLDGLRPIPARITAPAGDPFARILGGDGRWLMIWIPE